MEVITASARPAVFEYTDYRKYLADSYQYLKTRYAQFSFRYFSKRAGFTSPNFLKLVIEGKRNLSDDSIPRFATALKMTQADTEFFTHLVHFGQSKTPTQRAASAESMLECKGYQKIYPLREAEFAYYANWFYIPVRELAGLSFFREDPEWIARTVVPQITAEDARQALVDLEKLGLLVRDAKGRLQQAQRTVSTANEVSSSAITRYHQDMLRLAAESIDRTPRDQREISAACVPLSKNSAAKAKLMVQRFRDELLRMSAEESRADMIYQINLQLFPVSREAKEIC